MVLILFGFWLLLNGCWTTEIAVTGAVLCGALYLLMWKFMSYSPRAEWKLFKRAGRISVYMLWLVREIIRSAFATIRLIWSPKLETEPVLTGVDSDLRTQSGLVVLADSITMTPGTITVDIRGKHLLVHCLDESFAEGLQDSEMERRLMKVEGGHTGA